jgi:hypothetical protein
VLFCGTAKQKLKSPGQKLKSMTDQTLKPARAKAEKLKSITSQMLKR